MQNFSINSRKVVLDEGLPEIRCPTIGVHVLEPPQVNFGRSWYLKGAHLSIWNLRFRGGSLTDLRV